MLLLCFAFLCFFAFFCYAIEQETPEINRTPIKYIHTNAGMLYMHMYTHNHMYAYMYTAGKRVWKIKTNRKPIKCTLRGRYVYTYLYINLQIHVHSAGKRVAEIILGIEDGTAP